MLEETIQLKEKEIEHITKMLVKACEENNLNYLAEGPKQSKEIKKNLDSLYEELFENTRVFEEKEKYYENEFKNINISN